MEPKLSSDGLFIIWNYTCLTTIENASDSMMVQQSLAELCTNSSSSYDDSDSESDGNQLHTITFKCIGSHKVKSYQDTLEKVAELLDTDKLVKVKLVPEPNNLYNSKAISFQCYIEGSWVIIGYIADELLNDLHDALTNNAITNVEFGSVKYVRH